MYEKEIVDAVTMQRALTRITYEIIEQNQEIKDIILVGIKTRGTYIAKRIAERLKQVENIEIPIGELDITTYRDDIRIKTNKEEPILNSLNIPFNIEGSHIILVDDVLFTGRTMRAALDAIMDFGRPRKISAAVLVDRGHKELPIKANFVGKNIPTSKNEQITVEMKEKDGIDRISIKKLK